MTLPGILNRIEWRFPMVLSGAALVAGAAFLAYAAMVSTGDTLPVGSKPTPLTLTVFSFTSLPPEVQALEASTAPLLFDRDTVTQHVAYDVSEVEATFEAVQPVSAIKVYGAAPYLLTVKAESAGALVPVAGLENLNLTKLPTGWTTFTAAAPVTTGKLHFVLTPATGGTATTLR